MTDSALKSFMIWWASPTPSIEKINRIELSFFRSSFHLLWCAIHEHWKETEFIQMISELFSFFSRFNWTNTFECEWNNAILVNLSSIDAYEFCFLLHFTTNIIDRWMTKWLNISRSVFLLSIVVVVDNW